MPGPHLNSLVPLLVILAVVAGGSWLLVRSAVRSGVRGEARRRAAAARRREMESWEATQRSAD